MFSCRIHMFYQFIVQTGRTKQLISQFGENISKLFFPNNEVFFQYLLDKYKLKWFNIPYEWHTYLMDAGGKIFNDDITKETVSKAKLIHLINKRFEELWKVL